MKFFVINKKIKKITLFLIILTISIPISNYKISANDKNSSSDQLFTIDNNYFNKYLFYPKNELNGTLIAQNKNKESNVLKAARSEQYSDSAENNLTIMYDNEGEPIKLRLRLKDNEPKNKRILISIYNIIGNKIGDVFEGTQSNYEEFYEEEFKKITSLLSNGLYLCVVQGLNFRLKLYQKFTISR